MDILEYTGLDKTRVKQAYQKIIKCIEQDDFYSAGVKKLIGSNYYRAELDYTNRLLFKIITYQDKRYALILEVIYNHAYDKSRFLRGAKVISKKINISLNQPKETDETIDYINKYNKKINILDKYISFDNEQQEIFSLNLPLIIIGCAGSGKSMLTLEKMKKCTGNLLYITNSPYLVENARKIYYANGYSNSEQQVHFKSYKQFLKELSNPVGKEVDAKIFFEWFSRQPQKSGFKDCYMFYEEFKGVITGAIIDKPYLNQIDYDKLGVKQSIFDLDDRHYVYSLFQKYLNFVNTTKAYFDVNIESFNALKIASKKYDTVIIDEIQDLTNVQVELILKTLKTSNHFIMCGDANQIIHPNFFSWSKIKSFFYHNSEHVDVSITRILNHNYRNSPQVIDAANKQLKVKTKRFGSIDKESHVLLKQGTSRQGQVRCFANTDKIKNILNAKTFKSTHYAVIVLREELKIQARKYFHTPLIFSVYETKGLEYENVILYNIISSADKKYRDIATGVTTEDLRDELFYARIRDKQDHSLEIYKFYMNALFVATTRAVNSIYMIERLTHHPLLKLIGIGQIYKNIDITLEESSLDAWESQAEQLELQGRQEQADEIREEILFNQSNSNNTQE